MKVNTEINMRRRFMTFNNDVLRTPFYIEALEDGVYYSIPELSEYKIDDGNWTVLQLNTNSESVNTGSRIYIKGQINNTNSNNDAFFKIYGRCKIGGNIQYLGYSDNAPYTNYVTNRQYQNLFSMCITIEDATDVILPMTTLADYCYQYMFYGCSSLTAAPSILPATILARSCYQYMFANCTSLTTAPELPATTLAENCYGGMFSSCSILTTAPELPATTLANICYSIMFSSCTSLNYIKMLATDVSAYGCLLNWVDDVSSTGTFVKAASMTSLPTGVDGIPSGWKVRNA